MKLIIPGNSISSELVSNLHYHFLISDDSKAFLLGETAYFIKILNGEYSEEILLKELLDKNGKLERNFLFNEKKEPIKVKDYYRLANECIGNPKYFRNSKDISKRTKDIIQGVLFYSLYLIELFAKIGEDTPKQHLIGDNIKMMQLLMERKETIKSGLGKIKESIEEIKKMYYNVLINDLEIQLEEADNIELKKRCIDDQMNLVALSLKEGDVKALKKFSIFQFDLFSLFEVGSVFKNIYQTYSRYREIEYDELDVNGLEGKYSGFALAFIEYLEHLKKLEKNFNENYNHSARKTLFIEEAKVLYTNKKTNNTKRTQYSYKLITLMAKEKNDWIYELHDNLIKHEFIYCVGRKERDREKFAKIFSGKVITEKIGWIPANVQLYEFISFLKPFITDESWKKRWAIAERCFARMIDNIPVNLTADKIKNHNSTTPSEGYAVLQEIFSSLPKLP